MMSDLDNLKSLVAALRSDFDAKKENTANLTTLITLLETCLQKPDSFLPDMKAHLYFFEEFSMNIISGICKQTYFVSREVINKSIHTIV